MKILTKKILFILLLILIVFLAFYIFSNKSPIYENYSDIETYDIYFLMNSITDNVIIIEGSSNGIIITTASKGKKTIGYSYLKMNLKQAHSDILDIQNANGQYWYFNYNSQWGSLNTNLKSSCKNEVNTGIVDLSQYDQNQIFENAIFFKNGTMITFDITGTHMIIGKIPMTNSISNVQAIFALNQYDKTNLNGNSMTILYYNGKDINNFYYNGSCGINDFGTSKNNINLMDTLATLSPTNKKISVLQFSNGCFIDGTQPGFLLRFIGEGSVIQFDFSGNYDILQMWNIFLSNYFYYNTRNQIGISDTRYSVYTLSQKNRNYWNLKKLNLLPYPVRSLGIPTMYSSVDQIIIYNTQLLSSPAILIQVDTCPYGQSQGNNLPQGTNNWSLTISSIFYNNEKKEIRINPNAISKFSFNFNCGRGDLIDFIVNNGNSKNNTMYYYYNSGNITGNNRTPTSTPPPTIKGKYNTGGTEMSVFPNNLPFGTGNITLPTKTYPYAFRDTSPNRLVFQNTITFNDNTQMGIDKYGNCILKGNSTQVEFNIAKRNGENNLNIFSINQDGSFNLFYNNFMYNGTTTETPIASNQTSGTLQTLGDIKESTCFDTIQDRSFVQNASNQLLNYNYAGSIPSKKNSNGGFYWTCDSIQNDLKNNYLIRFPNGYETPYGAQLGNNSILLLDYKFTPSQLVSNSPINIINDKVQSKPVDEILFSNGMSIKGNLQIQGLYGYIYFNMGSTTKYMMEIYNNSMTGGDKNGILNYNDGKNELLRETFIPEGIIHWIREWGDCGIAQNDTTIATYLNESGNLMIGEEMSTDKNPKSTDPSKVWPCSSYMKENFLGIHFGHRQKSSHVVVHRNNEHKKVFHARQPNEKKHRKERKYKIEVAKGYYNSRPKHRLERPVAQRIVQRREEDKAGPIVQRVVQRREEDKAGPIVQRRDTKDPNEINIDDERHNYVVRFSHGYRDILGKTIPPNAICYIEPIKGILHHILSWGNCGIKPSASISITETTGNLLVGRNMSTNSNSKSQSDGTGWSCENVLSLNPVDNKLIYNFPNGYKDIMGNNLPKGSVCVLEPIIGILHYIGSWGDCGINENEVHPISIPYNSGNFLVGKDMSSSSKPDSTDTTTGWPCSSVSHINPLSNNLVVIFPNGYFDYNGNSIIKGGVCVIEPINYKFLDLFYGIKTQYTESDLFSRLTNKYEIGLPGGSWKNSARNYRMEDGILYAQLKNDRGGYNNASVRVIPGATYNNINGGFQENRKIGMFGENRNTELPGGSWKNSARNYRMEDGILYAQLKNDRGGYNNASVRVVPGVTYNNINGGFQENRNNPTINYSMPGERLNNKRIVMF